MATGEVEGVTMDKVLGEGDDRVILEDRLTAAQDRRGHHRPRRECLCALED